MKPSIKQRMRDGQTVFGTWCMLPSSFVVDVIARTGVDFIVVDMEHGTMSFETAEEMVRAAEVHGCQAVIRVGDDQPNTILHALETGCEAIMVPHVSTPDAAREIVSVARYAPLGSRGLSPYTRCHNYTHVGLAESLKRHADETLVAVLVEGTEGISNLPQIAAVPGLDLIYLGMYDISQSVGLPGALEHPDVLAQLERCLTVIQKAGKIPGTFARDLDASKRFMAMGFGLVAYVADSHGLYEFFRQAVACVKQ